MNTKALQIIKKYTDKDANASEWKYIEAQVSESIATKKPITLISFTCSTINSEYMYDQKNPEKYVSLDPCGNNLEVDLPRLQDLYVELSEVYPVKIVILIGNTDPYYIYTQQAKMFSFGKEEFFKRFNKRWVQYKKNLDQSIKEQFPKLTFELISWYEFETSWKENGWDFEQFYMQTYKRIKTLYKQSDFDWELSKLNEAFGPGKYFEKLKKPSQTVLKDWILRKFSEYTVQGFWIKLFWPEGILIQNEKPSLLRTKMYQPLIEEYLQSRLPVIYPYGIDNSGYQ